MDADLTHNLWLIVPAYIAAAATLYSAWISRQSQRQLKELEAKQTRSLKSFEIAYSSYHRDQVAAVKTIYDELIAFKAKMKECRTATKDGQERSDPTLNRELMNMHMSLSITLERNLIYFDEETFKQLERMINMLQAGGSGLAGTMGLKTVDGSTQGGKVFLDLAKQLDNLHGNMFNNALDALQKKFREILSKESLNQST